MEGKLSWRGSFLGGPEMELPERGQKGSYLGRWRESYLLRDEGSTVLDTDGEGSTREPHRESYLRVDGERATLEEWRGSYLGENGGVATWVGRTQISSLRCWTLGRACIAETYFPRNSQKHSHIS
jgi:hypothetical protein